MIDFNNDILKQIKEKFYNEFYKELEYNIESNEKYIIINLKIPNINNLKKEDISIKEIIFKKNIILEILIKNIYFKYIFINKNKFEIFNIDINLENNNIKIFIK